MLEAFAAPRIDRARARRLVLGACAGAASVAALGGVLTRVPAHAPPVIAPDDEPVVPVALVETPQELPEEPPPPSDPSPAPAGPGPRRPAAPTMPTKVPEGVKQADPGDAYDDGSKPATFDGPGGGGSGTGTGRGTGAPPPPPPPKVEAPPPKKAALSPEEYDAPKCKLGHPDRAAAKAIGVEGTIVVKYTVTESGAITNAKVVKGPPELHGLALAALSASRCEPARLKADGSAITVTRTVRYPIRFSTE